MPSSNDFLDIAVSQKPIRIRSNECFRIQLDAGDNVFDFRMGGFYRLYMCGIWYRSLGGVVFQSRSILRPLKIPLYDTVNFRGSLGDHVFGRLDLFTVPIGQAGSDGWPKTEADTNMTQAQQLGTPEEFDLWGFRAEMASNMPRRRCRMFLERCLWRFWFGDTIWHSGPLSTIPCMGVTAPTALQASRLPLADRSKDERAGARRIRGGAEDA